MQDEYGKLFSSIREVKVPTYLEGVVLARIRQVERTAIKVQIFVFGVASLGILSLAVPVLRYVASGFSQSGFYQYFSLLFSDSDAILSHFADFLILLGESVPLFSLVVLFSFAFFCDCSY